MTDKEIADKALERYRLETAYGVAHVRKMDAKAKAGKKELDKKIEADKKALATENKNKEIKDLRVEMELKKIKTINDMMQKADEKRAELKAKLLAIDSKVKENKVLIDRLIRDETEQRIKEINAKYD